MTHIPFGAIKDTQAQLIARSLSNIQQRAGRPMSIVFSGQWSRRRFVIDTIHEADEHNTSAVKDIAAGRISLPVLPASDWKTYTNLLRGFGMQIELAERKLRQGFEIVNGPDGDTHRVRKSHHIAACGLRGPWPDTVLARRDGGDVGEVALTCCACEKARVDGK